MTASTWSSTTRSSLLRPAVSTADRSADQGGAAPRGSVCLPSTYSGGSAVANPSSRPTSTISSERSCSRSRPGLFLYFRVRPSRNSATVAGCGYTSIARRDRPERGFMSSPSRAAIRAPRGSRNSGLPVLDGWAPASKRAKSLFSAASAGRLPVALVTISGASIATRQSPATYGSRASTMSSSVIAADTWTR